MTKHIAQTYQILDEISHIRQRSGIYVGSTTLQSTEEWIFNNEDNKMEKKEISYIPAFIKVVSEILDNAIDESKRAPDVLTTIKVNIDGDSISIQDNGRGIPVEIHPESNQYVAETIFSNLRAGSNFNDSEDQALIGTNGLGSKLCNILSQHFKIESCDGKKLFRQEFWNGMTERSDPKISASEKHGTKITFSPDYEFFKLESGLDKDHTLKIHKKVIDAAACNINVNFYFNNQLIKIKTFDDYIKLYSDDYLTDNNTDWKVGVSSSDGFDQVSFVNSVETYVGGTHVDYVSNQIVSKLREYFKKKHKVDIKPSDIKNHFRIYISANINRPKFSAQTKELLVSPASEWKTSWSVSDKFIKNILKTEIVQSVLDWISAKEKAQELADLRKANKTTDKSNPKSVDKFHDATTKDRSEAILLLAEGDSAMSAILSGRNTKTIAAFPLRGKPINVTPMSIKDILDNQEFRNIMTITGLQIGEKAKVENLRFSKIVVSSDQDLDGMGIRGLLFNLFYKFWPELFDLGIIHILNTPIVKITYKKDIISFYKLEDFEQWKKNHSNENYHCKYYKGLGTSSSKEWKEYLNNIDMNMERISLEKKDKEIFELLFSKDKGMADKRKDWLKIEEI